MAKAHAGARALPWLVVAIALGACPGIAHSVPGSGTATVDPSTPVPAGSYGTWTLDYVTEELFAPPIGGVVVFTIPADWSPPSADPLVGPGHVTVTISSGAVDSMRVIGHEVWVWCGGAPGTPLVEGDHVICAYGAPAPAGLAQAQTTAGSAEFRVLSDPQGGSPAPLVAGSPSIAVIASMPEMLRFVPATVDLAAGVPASIRLWVEDAYGNPSSLPAAQLLSLSSGSPTLDVLLAGVPVSEVTIAADSSGVSLAVREIVAGTGVSVRASDGDGVDPPLTAALAAVTTAHGLAAAITVSGIADSLAAGTAASAALEVRDAFGNRATSYVGEVRFLASDGHPAVEVPLPYTFSPADAGLHLFAGEIRLATAGEQWVRAEDTGDPAIAGTQGAITVVAASADSLVVSGISDPLVAATRSDVEVEAHDRFGNRALDYLGTIQFATDDLHPGVLLPADYAFTAADSGQHRFPDGVRLMSAGEHWVSATEVIDPGIDGRADGIDVVPGEAVAGMFTPQGSAPVTVGAVVGVVLTITDAALNPVPGEPATIAILDAADGRLAPDPAHPGGTFGSDTVQSGLTDANGALTIRYHAPAAAGASDRLGAWTATLPAGAIADLVFTTVAAGATELTLASAAAVDSAFAVFDLTVEARDSFGNRDLAAAPLVRLLAASPSARFSVDGGGVWSSGPLDSLVLAAGTSDSRLKVRDPAAGTLALSALDAAGFLISVALDLTVTPAPPAGAIPLAVVPDTLTADGESESQITGGPVADRHGNAVSGFPVTVASTAGEVRGPDEDPAPGIQKHTDAAGFVSFPVRAADSPAIAQISADTSPVGSAFGSAALAFLAPATFDVQAFAPPAAAPGDTVMFRVMVANQGPAAVDLDAGTTVQLTDADGSTIVTALASPFTLPAGGAGELVFAPAVIDTALALGRYTPRIRLRGQDAHGAAVDVTIAAPFEGFAIGSLALEAVLAPARVSRGQDAVPVQVVVRNSGGSTPLVTDLGLDMSAPAYAVCCPTPALPHALAPGAQATYTLLVDVDPLATLGPVVIDARLTFTAGGVPRVLAGAAAPATWTVEQAAMAAYVPGSLGPPVVSIGQTHEAAVVMANQGGAAVVLETALSRIVVGEGGNTVTAALGAPVVIPGQSATLLRFPGLTIPAAFPRGRTRVEIALGGLENGAPFAFAAILPDSITVEAPALLEALAGTMAPDSVAIGQERSFSLVIANHGGAQVMLEPGTVLHLDGASGEQALALAGAPVAIAAGAQAPVVFGPAVLLPALGSGLAAAEIRAVTRENDVPSARVIPVPNAIAIELPAALRWVAGSLLPARVTRGQPAAFALTLANDGEAAVTVSAGSELRVSDGVHVLSVTYAGPPLVLAGGGAAGAFAFPSALVPADLAPLAYAPSLALLTREHGIESVTALVAAPGELTVEAPVDARYVPGSITPDLATGGQVVRFRIEVENRGGATLLPDAATRLSFGGFSTGLDVVGSPAAIAGGATDTLAFLPAAIGGVETGVFAPEVELRGEDGNGAPVATTLFLAPDVVTVVRGAALRLERLLSHAPRAARVNRNQGFGIGVAVANRGEEAVDGAAVELSGTGLAAPVAIPIGPLAPGDSVVLTAPATAAAEVGAALVTARITGGAGAISGAPPVIVAALDDTLALAIEREAGLRPRLAVRAPDGARDGIASGGSLLDLDAWVDNEGDAPIGTEGELTLAVPPGFGVLGPAAQTIVAGAPIAFAVLVPPGGAPLDSLRVTITRPPLDLNSGGAAQLLAQRATAAMAAVTPARLAIALSIVEPQSALEGLALPEQVVTLEAEVTNQGQAAAAGPGELHLDLDPALALAPGESADRPFTVGVPVRFLVVAAEDPGPPHPITARLTLVPADENSGLPAQIERSEARVSLATQLLGAEVAGEALAASPHTLVRGAPPPAAVMSLTVRNPAPPVSSPALVLRGIRPALTQLVVVDGNRPRAALAAGGMVAPETVLGRMELRRDTAQGPLAASWDPADGEPVLALADTLAGQETRTYVLLVGGAQNAPPGTYQLDLAGSAAFEIRETLTDLPVTAVTAPGSALTSSVFTLFEDVQVVPNPFVPGAESAGITYVLAGDAPVEIEIFTLFGDRVWAQSITAGDPGGRAGLNAVPWDGKNESGQAVRNGVYHCRVRGGGLNHMMKIAAIR